MTPGQEKKKKKSYININTICSALNIKFYEAKLFNFVQLKDYIKTLYTSIFTPPTQEIFLPYFRVSS